MTKIQNNQNIYIKSVREKGKSTFARKSFKRGKIIFIIAGPVINKKTKYTIPISHDLNIDPLDNAGKYLNHSCNPNAGIKQRTIVVAIKNIRRGEEITIDYAMIIDRYGNEIARKDLICKCGNKNCRGELGSWSRLPKKLKNKYRGFVSDYLLSKK